MTNETTTADCPFCLSNNLFKGEILAKSDGAFLTENVTFPGNYLIIPATHAESPLELPDEWWKDVKELLPQIPGLTADYNLSFNIGRQAGQTVKHLHLWVIPRTEGQPASGKGFITLANFYNEHA